MRDPCKIVGCIVRARGQMLLTSLVGGSISNICGLNVARFKKFPEVKAKGMQALPKLCIFTSEQVSNVKPIDAEEQIGHPILSTLHRSLWSKVSTDYINTVYYIVNLFKTK